MFPFLFVSIRLEVVDRRANGMCENGLECIVALAVAARGVLKHLRQVPEAAERIIGSIEQRLVSLEESVCFSKVPLQLAHGLLSPGASQSSNRHLATLYIVDGPILRRWGVADRSFTQ